MYELRLAEFGQAAQCGPRVLFLRFSVTPPPTYRNPKNRVHLTTGLLSVLQGFLPVVGSS